MPRKSDSAKSELSNGPSTPPTVCRRFSPRGSQMVVEAMRRLWIQSDSLLPIGWQSILEAFLSKHIWPKENQRKGRMFGMGWTPFQYKSLRLCPFLVDHSYSESSANVHETIWRSNTLVNDCSVWKTGLSSKTPKPAKWASYVAFPPKCV